MPHRINPADAQVVWMHESKTVRLVLWEGELEGLPYYSVELNIPDLTGQAAWRVLDAATLDSGWAATITALLYGFVKGTLVDIDSVEEFRSFFR